MNRFIIYFLMIVLPVLGKSQSILSHYMDDLPQSRETNFSNLPDYRFTLGLPVVANTELEMYTSSSVNDLFDLNTGNTLILDVEDIIGNLRDISYAGTSIRTDLLTASFKIAKTYVSLNFTTRFESEIRIPKALFELGWYGNGKFIGETADLSGLGFDLKLYNEYGITATHKFLDKITIGGSLKYLQGLANIYTPANSIGLTTDTTTYWLNANVDAEVRFAGPIDTNGFEDLQSFSDAFMFGNSGMALGLGGSYKLNDKFKFDLNISDLGFITWKNSVKTYSVDGDFSFKGIIFDTSLMTLNMDSLLTSLSDSIVDIFKVKNSSDKYVSALRAKLFLSATYNLGEKNRFGFIFYNRFGKYSNYSSFSLAYHRKFGNWLSAGLSYSIDNLGFSKVGAALNLKVIGSQFYFLSDDIMTWGRPLDARYMGFRFGWNIMMKTKDK